MREVVVLSGKGGTGKTSVTAAFAACAAPVVMADADVDAADLFLVARPETSTTDLFYSGYEAVIDPSRCTGCGACLSACRYDALGMVAGVAAVDTLRCEGCGVCEWVCPEKAVTMQQPVAGEILRSSTRFGPMVHARMRPGGENSGKLVAQVRRAARLCAEETGADWLLVDGPPGIGCPVISAVTGADHVIAVTEATVSGEHDLDRLWTLIDHFGVSASLIINKADIAPSVAERIAVCADARGYEVLGQIPYDPVFTRAQLAGLSVLEFDTGPVSLMLRDCWMRLTARFTGAPV